jgi:hypothetical protein
MATLPAALQRTAAETLEEEVAQWRGATTAQRVKAVVELSALAMELLRANPNRKKAMAWQDPIPEASKSLWERLVREAREPKP